MRIVVVDSARRYRGAEVKLDELLGGQVSVSGSFP